MGTCIVRRKVVKRGKNRSGIGAGELDGAVDNRILAGADHGGYSDGEGQIRYDIWWGGDFKDRMGTAAESHQSCYRNT